MRIAVIGSKGLPPHQGGIEHHCAEIYPRMVSAGHSVDLYARSSYNSGTPAEYYKGVRVLTIPSIPVRGIDALSCSGLAAIVAAQKSYDIVHFHALGPALFSPLPRLFSGAKVITTCHGLDWQRSKWGALSSRIIKLGEKSAVKFSDQIVVVSEALRTYFWKRYSIETPYIENAPVPYADSDAQFTYGQQLGLTQGRYLLFLGRLVPEKRADLLLKAFRAISMSSQYPEWKLVLVGDRSDTSSFTSELLQLSDNHPDIIFTGRLQGQRLSEIVRGAGLFVLPSDIEGLPLALLEAMAEKVPTVISDIPVHRHMAGDDRGLTFRAGDRRDLQSKLEWAMSHPKDMVQMAANAKRYVQENHNWDTITRKYTDLYASLLNPQYTTVRPIRTRVGSKSS